MASGAAGGTLVFKQMAVKACEDREISVWDSNAESVRRRNRRVATLKNSRRLLSSPQKESRLEKGRQNNRRSDTGWTWRRDEFEEDEDDYEVEYDYDEDDEEGLDWRKALGLLGLGLPAAFIAIPWLVGNPMTFTMLLALAPLAQRAFKFAASIWNSINEASSQERWAYKSSFKRSSRRRKPVVRPAYVQDDLTDKEEADDRDHYKSWEPPEKDPSTDGWEELEADRQLVLKRRKYGRASMSRYSYKPRKRLPLFWRFVLAIFPFLRSWGGFL